MKDVNQPHEFTLAPETPFENFCTLVNYIMNPMDPGGADFFLFRGQANANHEKALLPKIYREEKTFIEKENDIIEDFKRQSIPLLNVEPKTEWDWLALAQHHGLYTRLLDWTRNPLAAVWFAVETDKDKDGVVWVMPSVFGYDRADTKTSPFHMEGQKIKIFPPSHITKRIIAQAGLFTIHPTHTPLEQIPEYTQRLVKIHIPKEVKPLVEILLEQYNIHYSSFFPDMDGLCKNINGIHFRKFTQDKWQASLSEYIKTIKGKTVKLSECYPMTGDNRLEKDLPSLAQLHQDNQRQNSKAI